MQPKPVAKPIGHIMRIAEYGPGKGYVQYVCTALYVRVQAAETGKTRLIRIGVEH